MATSDLALVCVTPLAEDIAIAGAVRDPVADGILEAI